jgi:putative acetyltransferase
MSTLEITIRKAEDSDFDALCTLIGGCFEDYEGCVLDLKGIDSPVLAIDSYVSKYNGEFWLAIFDEEVVGSVGYIVENDKMELIKLYVDKTIRRKGLASKLLNLVLDAAASKKVEVDLWSDTRFVEAHAFYAHHGFDKQEETRFLNDPSNSWEFHFIRGS